MGFFKEFDTPPPTNKPPTPFDVGAGRFLYRNLSKARLCKHRPDYQAWGNHIRLLRTVDGVPPQRVRLVLEWYVKNIRDPHMPQAHSTKTFRAKFRAIEAAMQRGADPAVKSITDHARKLVKQAGLYWPASVTEDDVLFVTQASINNYTAFLKGLRRIRDDPTLHRYTRGLADYINRFTCQDVDAMVLCWLTETHSAVHHTHGWAGNLRRWAWRPQHRRYAVPWGRAWAADYIGNPAAYDTLLELL